MNQKIPESQLAEKTRQTKGLPSTEEFKLEVSDRQADLVERLKGVCLECAEGDFRSLARRDSQKWLQVALDIAHGVSGKSIRENYGISWYTYSRIRMESSGTSDEYRKWLAMQVSLNMSMKVELEGMKLEKLLDKGDVDAEDAVALKNIGASISTDTHTIGRLKGEANQVVEVRHKATDEDIAETVAELKRQLAMEKAEALDVEAEEV